MVDPERGEQGVDEILSRFSRMEDCGKYSSVLRSLVAVQFDNDLIDVLAVIGRNGSVGDEVSEILDWLDDWVGKDCCIICRHGTSSGMTR